MDSVVGRLVTKLPLEGVREFILGKHNQNKGFRQIHLEIEYRHNSLF